MENKKMTAIQNAAFDLLRSDFRYLFTVISTKSLSPPNYSVAMMPYLGLVVDGAENWISTMNRLSPGIVEMPTFAPQEKLFYQKARSSIKLWGKSYSEIYAELLKLYSESDEHFSSLCKPIAKTLKLYDIFGTYVIDGHYAGNTVLWALTLPGYHLNDENYGPILKHITTIAGTYATKFDALQSYSITQNLKCENRDFGGFIKSPVGNKFSYRFVLFSLLCQINFIIYGLERPFIDESPTKLRFSYILYYYLCDILPQINSTHKTRFSFNPKYKSSDFRNATAHYKLGAYLKPEELIADDLMYGMAQKAFGLDYYAAKDVIISELTSLSQQIEMYLGI